MNSLSEQSDLLTSQLTTSNRITGWSIKMSSEGPQLVHENFGARLLPEGTSIDTLNLAASFGYSCYKQGVTHGREEMHDQAKARIESMMESMDADFMDGR